MAEMLQITLVGDAALNPPAPACPCYVNNNRLVFTTVYYRIPAKTIDTPNPRFDPCEV